MTTRPNERVDTQARILDHLALDITRALEHVQRELRACDWHPADTMAGSGTRGGEPASPTERVALARSELTGRREDIRDWITGLESFTRSGRFLVDETLKIRTPSSELFDATEYGVRCKGIDPTCTNWASKHLLLSRTVCESVCDTCWPETCKVHGDHPHEGRRVEGVLCCQAAYRKWQRDTAQVA